MCAVVINPNQNDDFHCWSTVKKDKCYPVFGGLSFLDFGNYLLCAGFSGELSFLRDDHGELVLEREIQTHKQTFVMTHWSWKGEDFLVTGGWDKRICVHQCDGKLIFEIKEAHVKGVNSLCSWNGWIVSASTEIKVWECDEDIKNDSFNLVQKHAMKANSWGINCVLSFNNQLWSASRDWYVCAWDTSFQCVCKIQHPNSVHSICPWRDHIASSAADSQIRIISKTGQIVKEIPSPGTIIQSLVVWKNHLCGSGPESCIIKVWNWNGDCVMDINCQEQILTLFSWKGILHTSSLQRKLQQWKDVKKKNVLEKPTSSETTTKPDENKRKYFHWLHEQLHIDTPWKTKDVPLMYWNDLKNQRQFFDWAAKELGISNYEGWYNQTAQSVRKLGAGVNTMMHRLYGNNLAKALQAVYPDTPWQLWKFKKVPQGYWQDINHMREYVEYLASELHVKQLSDWYLIDPYHQIPKCSSIMAHYNSFYDLLKILYPDYNWQPIKQANRKIQETVGSKGQYLLFRTLQELFHGADIINNYKQSSGRLELDIYLPDHRLAFEYQGTHHYTDHFLNGPVDIQQSRDEAKRSRCKELGITLIEIPFWWDRSKSSLIATIHQHRPDLIPLPVQGTPIDMSFKQHPPRLKEKDDSKASYYIGVGKPRGHAATCSGCRKPFSSASEPRLCVKGVFTPPSSHIPRPAIYYVCLTKKCLEKALDLYMLQNETGVHSAGIHFPYFEHKIQVPQKMREQVREKVEGLVDWNLWDKAIEWNFVSDKENSA